MARTTPDEQVRNKFHMPGGRCGGSSRCGGRQDGEASDGRCNTVTEDPVCNFSSTRNDDESVYLR
jgi:hypothetical protein